jgi:AraC-like DNA-binding protein
MTVWDIAERPPREQFGYWHEVVCQAFVPLTPRKIEPTDGFPSRVEARPLGRLNRAGLRSVPQTVAHGPREVNRSDEGFYFVNLQLDGDCRVRTVGRETTVRPGSFTVVDTTEPYWFEMDVSWRMLSYRLPHSALHAPRETLGTPIDATDGLGGVVGALMHSLWTLPDDSPDELVESFGSMLALTLSRLGPSPVDAPHATRAAVMRYVGAHLGNPALSVTSVCRHFGFSPRYLHSLFAGESDSFAATVRGLRLDRCAGLIAEPGRRETITAIAARHGFTDPTSFSRAFRRRFDVAPREYRTADG